MGAIYVIELTAMKAAFIAFYWGLFQGVDSKRKYAVPVVSVIVVMAFFAMMGIYVFWITPISENW